MKAIKLVAALIGLGFVGSAMAAATANVAVSATVVGACKVTQAGKLGFTLDPTTTNSGATPTSTQDVVYWCTNGTTIALSSAGANDSGTQKRMTDGKATPTYINYSFTGTPSATAGGGSASPITLTVGGSVADAAFATAPAGGYSDSITVTITTTP